MGLGFRLCLRTGCLAFLQGRGHFGPIVLGIASREVFLHLGIAALPETFQVLGHLPGTLVRREHLHLHRPAGNSGCLPHPIQLLYLEGNRGILPYLISHSDCDPITQFDPFGRITLEG